MTKIVKRLVGSLLRTVCVVVVMSAGNDASSSEVDVCVNVLQNITGTVEEYRCGSILSLDPICALNPICCIPQVCKVTPACGLERTVIKTIAKKGDVHCFEDIDAGELWQRWKDKQIAFVSSAMTLGLAELLLPFYKGWVATIALRGDPIPPAIQTLLEQIIGPVYDHGVTGFSYEDIRNVKIINVSHDFDTKRFVKIASQAGEGDFRGSTLGPVIILSDRDYDQLTDPDNVFSLIELLTKADNEEFAKSVETLVHEMVHVKQHRELGQDTFTLNYLLKNAPIVTDGYGKGPYEQEAYNFTADIIELHGGQLCEATAAILAGQNIANELGRAPVVCNPYVAWMIPLIY